ncbi:MAG: hypothetical protein E6R03_12365 [Hyphomicrobiaceae bacterium]|nr:MAG: hypothetical protein E6R03_12365 [Hyphomicrobiaceae bacterium]
MTIQSEVEEVVREMGPVTAMEVIQLMPHATRQQVYARLNALEAQGKISSEKIPDPKDDRRKVNRYSYGGKPREAKPRKAKAPTNQAQVINAGGLLAKIAELEAWKGAAGCLADAIARFPDLAVDPDTIRARDIIHKMLIDSGDRNLAADVLAGKKDETMLVRACVAALAERG